ncbi:hypothetical protein AMTR_s00011p00240700 [Amborella trichopoda]|uniref:Uncharacterized protein n=1 Tax=Amborella trichopoda TaxID=13333 RepID=W1NG13_AMBTC|nr:hypothetical protein AMTR_s00011p00240700 [Amborella trichopoda]
MAHNPFAPPFIPTNLPWEFDNIDLVDKDEVKEVENYIVASLGVAKAKEIQLGKVRTIASLQADRARLNYTLAVMDSELHDKDMEIC